MTFSIVAWDAGGNVGLASHSAWPCHAPLVSAWRDDTVAIVQARGEPGAPAAVLDRLQASAADHAALTGALATATRQDQQLLAARPGWAAAHTGADCWPIAAQATGPTCAAACNLAATDGVADAMVATFEEVAGELALRLVTALAAGQEAGGDLRGKQSAAVVTVGPDGEAMDVRVDTSVDPIGDLDRACRERLALARLLDPAVTDARACVEAALDTADTAQVRFWAGLQVLAPAGLLAEARRVLAPLRDDPRWEATLRAAPAGLTDALVDDDPA